MSIVCFLTLAAQTQTLTQLVTDEAEEFVQSDPYGLIMALFGMGIVFMALLMFYLIFSNTPVLFTASFRQKLKNLLKSEKNHKALANLTAEKTPELSGEVNAAIAVAIHLYRNELHDLEDTVLTIKKVSRIYSPWSSKIYGLRRPLAS